MWAWPSYLAAEAEDPEAEDRTSFFSGWSFLPTAERVSDKGRGKAELKASVTQV